MNLKQQEQTAAAVEERDPPLPVEGTLPSGGLEISEVPSRGIAGIGQT